MQKEILESTRLLDGEGNVSEPGYCKTNRYLYSRKEIRANPLRIKEWDFYQISDERYTVQMTFGDISMGGAASFTLFDRKTGERFEAMTLKLLTLGRFHLPEDTNVPHRIRIDGPLTMSVSAREGKRRLAAKGKIKGEALSVDISLNVPKGLEYLTMAVPFKEKGHFYLNQKMNCMAASGVIRIGERIIVFDPKTAFCVLDWGRGVWPYHEEWYWGNGSTLLPDGKLFGFEIGWGFGDMSAASENMVFYEGKGHKIGYIALDRDADYMQPWHFLSDDGRFDMIMTPEFDNATSTRVLGLVGNRCHQVFGKWNGKVILDDGKVLEIHDMTAFCEHSDNRW